MMNYRLLFAAALIPLAVIGLVFVLPETQDGKAPGGALLFDNVRLFDGEQDRGIVDVSVTEGRVVQIADRIESDGEMRIIDGRGKTLLPGLIDAHTHAFDVEMLRDALRFGVVAELDMFTNPTFAATHRAQNGKLAPTDKADFYSAGFLATSPGGHGTQFGIELPTLAGPDQAQAWVDARLAEGSDYIKIVYTAAQFGRFPSISRETLGALVDAAHTRGALAVVHAQSHLAADHAVAAGADGLVHIFGDRPLSSDLLADMAAREMFVIPALSIIETAALGEGGSAFRDNVDLMARVSAQLRGSLVSRLPTNGFTASWLKTAQDNVRQMHLAGVTILVGTDAPNPGTAHGISMMGELSLLVDSGLTPKQVLHAATSAVAQRFGLAGRGKVQPGSRADLVMVSGDALDDIAALQNLAGVWKNGVPVDLGLSNAENEALSASILGDFDDGSPNSSDLGVWGSVGDQTMGGQSIAEIQVTGDGTLRVSGEIKRGFFSPFAGTYFAFAQDWSKLVDLGGLKGVTLQVKGTPGQYRFMIFGSAQNAPPAEQVFTIGENWQTVRLPFSRFRGIDPSAVRAFAFSAGPGPGKFEFWIDDVRLVE